MSEQQHSDLSLCCHPRFFPQFFILKIFKPTRKLKKYYSKTHTSFIQIHFLFTLFSILVYFATDRCAIFSPKPFGSKLQTSMTFHPYFLLLHLRNLIFNIILSMVQISPGVSKISLTAFSFFFFFFFSLIQGSVRVSLYLVVISLAFLQLEQSLSFLVFFFLMLTYLKNPGQLSYRLIIWSHEHDYGVYSG